jgi:molybdate transport system regulatory protein
MAQNRHRLSIRIDLASGDRIGPGKIALLETIDKCGSISAAARVHGMAYTRAWRLIQDLNNTFSTPVILTTIGGGGQGATLTATGRALIQCYRDIEDDAAALARTHFDALDKLNPSTYAPKT